MRVAPEPDLLGSGCLYMALSQGTGDGQWELSCVMLVGGAQPHSFVDKHKLDIFEIEGLKPAKELILV